MGKERENFEIPDYYGIEIKTKYSTREEYVTLFSAAPDSYLFEIKRLVSTYGYKSKNLPECNVLNVGVLRNRKTKTKSNYYFKLDVDRKKEEVMLKIYDQNHELVDSNCKWSFQLLKEKLERKVSILAFINAERKWNRIERAVYFRYNHLFVYKLKSFEQFISLLEKGMIKIIFNIGVYKSGRKKGQIHDHGTSFAIKHYNINYLFDKITI